MLPAGKYFIGDLCYVMHPEWDEFCDITIDDIEGCLQGEFALADGRRFATYTTAYGDGTYYSSIGTSHSVDAGLIGCILLSDISEDLDMEKIARLGAVVEFDKPFETSGEDGVMHFGHVRIDTSDDYSDCEDDDDGYGSDW